MDPDTGVEMDQLEAVLHALAQLPTEGALIHIDNLAQQSGVSPLEVGHLVRSLAPERVTVTYTPYHTCGRAVGPDSDTRYFDLESFASVCEHCDGWIEDETVRASSRFWWNGNNRG